MAKASLNKETSSKVNKEKTLKDKKVSPSVKEKKEVVKPAKKTVTPKEKSPKAESSKLVPKVEKTTKVIKTKKVIKLEAPIIEAPIIEAPIIEAPIIEAPIIEAHVEKVDKVIHAEKIKDVVKIEPISILKLQNDEVPVYQVNQELENNSENTKIDFSKIVPQDDMVKSLYKANYKQATMELRKVLNAALRGSDVFTCMPSSNSAFLIGAIASTFKILNGSLTRVEAKQPVALILAASEKSAKDLFQNTTKVFEKSGVHFALLTEAMPEEEKKFLFEKHVDVIFSTVENIENDQNKLGLNLNSIGMCVCFEFDLISKNNSPSLQNLFKNFPQERIQKIFIANENTPKVRQIAFNYLDDSEYFYFLPCYVKDRQPKQFAHALTVTQKFQVLLGHLKHHKPMCAIVFANTKSVAEWIAYKLNCNGIKVELVTSTLNFTRKQQLIKQVNSGEINVIVTTDYQATSLGLENLNCMYQFDLPDSAEKFFSRLNLIEKSKSPISISFICEDYGYNMGKIEEKMGFKMHIMHPDKEYFNVKDVSDYPLEVDGRVKRIVKGAPAVAQPVVAQSAAQITAPIAKQETSQVSSSAAQIPRQAPLQASVQQSASATKDSFAATRPAFDNKTSQRAEQNKYQDKYIRRDDKAKDALDAARYAASQKQKTATTHSSKEGQSKNILSIAAFILQDAIKAASTAAKQSVVSNIEQNMPIFSGFLSKIPFLKQEKHKD